MELSTIKNTHYEYYYIPGIVDRLLDNPSHPSSSQLLPFLYAEMVEDIVQKLALDRILQRRSIAILGPAGHGKSFVIKEAAIKLREILGYSAVAIIALTNENASSMPGGVTFHALLGLHILEQGQEWTAEAILSHVGKNSHTQRKLKEIEVIGIDEGPVMWSVFFEALVLVLQAYGNHERHPLDIGGGCQFFTGGDPLQKGPYSASHGRLSYAFQSPLWAGIFRIRRLCDSEMGEMCLRTNHRLKKSGNDVKTFTRNLASVRLGLQEWSKQDALRVCNYFNSCGVCGLFSKFTTQDELKKAVNSKVSREQGILALKSADSVIVANEYDISEDNQTCGCFQSALYTRLCPTNEETVGHNKRCLNLLEEKEIAIKAEDTNMRTPREALTEALENLAPKVLQLKVGAMILTTRNFHAHDLPARSRGFIERIDAPEAGDLIVTCSFPTIVSGKDVEYPLWRSIEIPKMKHEVYGFNDGRVLCCRRQVPLKLSYSLTFAGSIGMEFRFVETDFRKGWEAPGLGYTALSRAKERNGLKCVGLKPEFVTSDPNALDYWNYVEEK